MYKYKYQKIDLSNTRKHRSKRMEYAETIDYSPNPSALDMTITLYEDNLYTASHSQIERFLRVWVVDRKLYAPKLDNLIIELHCCNKKLTDCVGIETFLSQYETVKGIKWSAQTTAIKLLTDYT